MRKRKAFHFLLACVVLLVIAFGTAWFLLRPAPLEEPPAALASGRPRPGAVYKPKAFPLRRAERPDLSALIAASKHVDDEEDDEEAEDEVDEEEDEEDTGEDEEEDEGEEVVPPKPIPSDDPALATLANERDFSKTVWSWIESPPDNLEEQAASLLGSDTAEDRALAGVLLFLADALDDDQLGRIVGDADPLVPLTVLDWVRDFGTDESVQAYREALSSRDFSSDDLLQLARNSASKIGGGRSALDLWLAGFPEEEGVPVDSLASIVTAPEVSYDVRAQAFFKLLEPETREAALKTLETFAAGQGEGQGELLSQTAEKWKELASISNSDGDEEKIWDSESAVVFYLSESDSALPARDLANYLEYALRRDDPEFPPIVEEGTWEFANECFSRLTENRDSLSQEELDALDRIAVSLDRLVEYDPAFNPFEVVEEGEEDEDEEEEDEDAEYEEDDADVEEDAADEEEDADEEPDEEEDAADEDAEDDEDAAGEDDGEEADEAVEKEEAPPAGKAKE